MMYEEKITGPYEPSISERLNRLEAVKLQQEPPKKEKKFRMPMKGKLGKSKLRQGYATVIEIAENDVIDFKREQIIDGTIKMKDTYHAVDDEDILNYKGKPLIIIPKKSKTPYNPNRVNNNTFAQKHIMSRMTNEVLGAAKKSIGIAGMSIGGIILIGIIAYAFIAG